MVKLDARVSKFESPDASESHDHWFQAKVERALADSRPTIPHDQVITEVRAAIAAAAERKTFT